MSLLRDDKAMTESLSQEVRQYLAIRIHSLQQARLQTLNNATLKDLFKGRNPYLLRATGQAAYQLMQKSLDHYLASTDAVHFANFSRDLAAFMEQSSGWQVEPADIIEHFAQDTMPLRVDILEEYDRSYNRLTAQFYLEFCDEDATIDWECFTRFITQSEVRESLRDAVDRTQ